MLNMRWMTVVMLVAGLALAGCESASDNAGAASGAGKAGTSAMNGAGAGSQQASRAEGPAPGSQQDLVVNVGDRVFFDFDSYSLRPDARATLEKEAQWMQQNPRVTVTIEGHADERGTREYNLALGERRANAVRDYLVALGVDPNRIKTVSYGKERPVDPRSTEEAWAKNRRGVMVVNK
jgi:peptidoglycan-associated lipoprotein